MKISNKLRLSLGLLALSLIACGLVGLYAKSLLSTELDYITGRAWNTADGAMEGVIGLQEQIIALQQMRLPGANLSALRERVSSGEALADESLSRMTAAGLIASDMVNKLNSKLANFNSLQHRLIEARTQKQLSTPELDEKFHHAVIELLDFIGQLEEQADSEVESRAATTASIESLATSLIIAAMLIGLAIAGASFVISRKSIVQPIQHTAELLREIAEGSGDLTVRLDVQSTDEIGEVAQSFNSFVQKLQVLMEQLQQSANEMARYSNEFAASSEHTRGRMTTQQQETYQVATAMTEMTATVQDISNNASDASRNTHEAQAQSVEGKNIVQQTISSINALAGEVTAASDVINTLEAGSQEIGGVLDVIKGIAEQTNLLALNAAIEAARAGEQGRGFAVVADEVRALAGRTQQSTAEIQGMIEALQASARNAVEVMERGNAQASASVEKVALAGDALDRITQAVGSINQLNTQIAVASGQQSTVTEEINQNINNINQAADATVEESSQTAQQSENLARIASDMNAAVGRFKLA